MSRRDSFFRTRVGWAGVGVVAGLAVGIGIGWWLAPGRPQAGALAAAGGGFGAGATAKVSGAPVEWPRQRDGDGPFFGGDVASAAIPVTGDFAEVFTALVKMDDSAARQRAVREVLARLPVEEWPALLAAMGKVKATQEVDDDPALHARVLTGVEEVLAAMAARDPVGSLKVVSEAGGEVKSLAFEQLLRYWARNDLTAALAHHEKSLRDDPHTPGTGALAIEFVQQDPAAALAWAAGLPEVESAEATLSALWTLSRRDPAAVREYLVGLSGADGVGVRGAWAQSGPPVTREWASTLAQHVAETWAQTDPQAAHAWASTLPPGLIEPALAAVVEPWFSRDWDEAWKAVQSMDGQAREAGLKAAADEMSPPQAVPVLNQLVAEPVGEAVAEAITDGARKYHHWAPEAAESWLAALPSGPHRDAAIQGVIDGGLGETDPEAAAAWAGAVDDPQQRAALLSGQLSQWFLSSPADARQWVETTDRLRPEDRAVWTGWLEQVGR